MLGAIIGDTIGSVYEFRNINTSDFQPLFHPEAEYTDDSVMSIAVADWLLNTDRSQYSLECKLVEWATKYPNPMGSYGAGFSRWLFHPEFLGGYRDDNHYVFTDAGKRHPYNSWGNGSAMRASACGWVAHSVEEALELGERSAEITHNHPEGIKGAQCVAVAIYMARNGASKAAICHYIEEQFGYDLHCTCDEIRPTYGWESSCQGALPAALAAFFDSYDYESAVRLAVSLGGDSDTIACITGGIAEAFYGEIPEAIVTEARKHIPEEFWPIINEVMV